MPHSGSGATGPDDTLRDALKRVAVILKDAGIPFALGGGYAAWARGGPEPDHDVDFLLPEGDVERALHRLGQAGLRVVDPPEDWLVKVFDGDEMVDLIHHPNGRPVTPEMISAAEHIDVASVTMPVLSATDIMVTKLLALTEHYCDLAKLLPVVRALREQVDWSVVRRSTAESPFAAAFLLLTDELRITRDDLPTLVQVVLDTTDARALAEFYRQFLGFHYRPGDEPPSAGEPDPAGSDWLVLRGGGVQVAFQQVAELPRPTWPEGEHPQMLHLDLTVPSVEALETQHARALALGATVLYDRSADPQEPLRVYADPAGHPFCVFVHSVAAGEPS